MAFDFFENAVEIGAISSSKDHYKDDAQALINDQWENTIAVEEIEEQDFLGNLDTFTFHTTEAWLNTIVGLSTTGSKESFDFVQLIFRWLGHSRINGRYYKFHDNYWIEYNDDRIGSAISHVSVRRCNNYLKIQDPLNNGAIYSIPCVVGYDMASPSARVTNDIITPNNHATIMVQENATTQRLFKTNTRFILSGRPFKLYGYQNATNQFPNAPNNGSLMELDLYLDELWDEDDLENGVAWNGYVEEQEEPIVEEGIVITPFITKIKEHQSIDIDITALYQEVSYVPDTCTATSDNPNLLVSMNGNTATLTCTQRSTIPSKLNVSVNNTSPSFQFSKEFEIALVSIMG